MYRGARRQAQEIGTKPLSQACLRSTWNILGAVPAPGPSSRCAGLAQERAVPAHSRRASQDLASSSAASIVHRVGFMVAPTPADSATSSRCLAPSAALLERAYVEHSGLVARIAYKLLRRPDEVNDVVQDVFVAAMQAGPRLNLTRSMAAWLATVTVRSAAKRLRRRRIRRALGLEADLSYERVPSACSDAEANLSVSRLTSALEQLPEELRSAWLLRHVEGESVEDVAKECGCSLSTAKRRINTAQARLRRVISDGPSVQ